MASAESPEAAPVVANTSAVRTLEEAGVALQEAYSEDDRPNTRLVYAEVRGHMYLQGQLQL
jgi:hypothetical protein